MSNEKSMSTGGASSAIGPALMRKAMPFRGTTQGMMMAERTILKDNSFRRVRTQISGLSFALGRTRISPVLDSRIQTVREQISRAVTFRGHGTSLSERRI